MNVQPVNDRFEKSRSESRNKRLAWSLSFLLSVLCVLFIELSVNSASVQGQDEGARKALSDSNLPWYNADTDQIQPIEIQGRKGATEDHSNLPRKIKKAKAANNATAGGGAGTGQGVGGGGASALIWAAIGVLIMALVGVLLWAFFRLESDESDQNAVIKRRRATADQIEALPFDVKMEGGDFRSLADSAYQQGDLRLAITYLFSHVLLSLDERELVRLRKGKTNRQYLAEIRAQQGAQRSLSDYYTKVMVTFEDTFFGDRAIENAEFEACRSGLDGFINNIDQASKVVMS